MSNWTFPKAEPPKRNPMRDEAVIRFAEVMLRDTNYQANPILNKSRLDYIAEDANELAAKLFPNGYPTNITAIEPTQA